MTYDTIYDPDLDFDRYYTDATAPLIADTIRPGHTVLELGCATGRMTVHLAAAGAKVTAVERSERYLNRARARDLPDVEWIHGDIEDLPMFPDGFDHVVAANVIGEVASPEKLLDVARRNCCGILHVTTANPYSLHRLHAAAMGHSPLGAISTRGHLYGTARMLDVEQLRGLAAAAGFREVSRGGVMIKPHPNAVMDDMTDAQIAGWVRLAVEQPWLAAWIGALIYVRYA